MGIFWKKNKKDVNETEEVVETYEEEQNTSIPQAYNNYENSLPTEQEYLEHERNKLDTTNAIIELGGDVLNTLDRISERRERTEQLRLKTAKDIENINKKWDTANNRINKAFDKDMKELGIVSKAMDAAIENDNMDAMIKALDTLSGVAKNSTSSNLNLKEIKDLYDDDF